MSEETEEAIHDVPVIEGVTVRPSQMPALRPQVPALPQEMSIEQLVERREKISQAMKNVMREGEHYGVIPGTQKPTLLKPGAEVLCQLFMFDPEYETEESRLDDSDHLTVKARCTLYHIPTGLRVASGEGSASSREEKYAFRNAQRVCPNCGQAQVRESQHAEEWYCWRKQGGCGAKWPKDSEQGKLFSAMEVGKIDNPNLPDTWNTILKMAQKRSLVAAVLNATAASDTFTQDVEDQAGAQAQPEGESSRLTDDTLAELRAVLDAVSYDQRWSPENVLTFASRKFQRQVGALDQLSEEEAGQVIAGAAAFAAANPPPEPQEPQPAAEDFEPLSRDG